jgi:GH15 family glucan-1,4-alpha-glucosidase
MPSKIEDYGLIGNGRTAALVAADGSMDWLCAPAFDSEACFSALLGLDEHGRWAIRPVGAVRERRRQYRGDTMILETEFVCDGGSVRIIDFMPFGTERCDVVRIIEGLEGSLTLEMQIDVRFGYGANKPWIVPVASGFRFVAGPDAIVLRSPGKLERTATGVSQTLEVRKGQRIAVQLASYESHTEEPPPIDAEQALAQTEQMWTEWADKCTYQGRWREAVVRSLLTLKAMTFIPTGAIVAAPTTSLPEDVGGVRNWDYRFCWLRDASLTLDALMIGGYVDEATAFRDWVLRATAGAPDELQIMYDLYGGRRLTEFELTWLPGYEGSHPVRVGNAASGQFQLDVYGEVLSAFYAGVRSGMKLNPENWPMLKALMTFIERAWQMPDDGIWEVRGGRRHFTHSKMMAWVAVDRAVRVIEEFGMGGDEGRSMLPHLQALRARIHEEVCDRGFNPRLGTFTQSYGSEALDASMLLLPHTGFLPARDPRVVGTVAAIEKSLVRDGFVLRYDVEKTQDGLVGTEGAFLACSFWLADNYAFAGRTDEAEELFERLLSLRNPLGLLAEEYDPRLQRQVGNFPQAFSHLALILSAAIIDTALRTGEGRIPVAGEMPEPDSLTQQ